jgi:hypothetical protein
MYEWKDGLIRRWINLCMDVQIEMMEVLMNVGKDE